MKRNNGSALPLILLGIAAIAAIIAVSAYAYYSTRSSESLDYTYPTTQQYLDPNSDNAIQTELESSEDADLETDLNEIDSSLNTL